MISKETVTVLNTPCILTNPENLTADLETWCTSPSSKTPLSVDFTNVHIVAMRTTDGEFHTKTSNVDWFVPDSQVLSWAVSLLGGKNHSRVYGPAYMDYYFRHGSQDITHYLLGASDHCLDALMEKLTDLQPNIQVVGKHNGYFSEIEEDSLIQDINKCQPDMVWVGLGTPKQQDWISRNKSLLNCKAILAVGFAFDVNAGTKDDAPAWLGPLGLTWLHRLLSEPKRLWKRYLIYNTVFLYRLCLQLISGKTSRHAN